MQTGADTTPDSWNLRSLRVPEILRAVALHAIALGQVWRQGALTGRYGTFAFAYRVLHCAGSTMRA